MKFLSWNVNGARAGLDKNTLVPWMAASGADAICLQETKCHPGDVAHVSWPSEYKSVTFHAAEKKGYSGTAILSKHAPLAVRFGMGRPEHDGEGRVLTAEFADFFLVNVYTPNAQDELRRLAYRQEWDRVFLDYLRELEKTKPVVTCGDFNVAHQEIDLARPKDNVKNPGFTPEERAGFSEFIRHGFVDTFREFEKGPGHYSWWSYRGGARGRNVGWRIDYFLASAALRPKLRRAWIEPHVMGSDHCPVGVEIAL
ncbi:MAG: exodeoxyribonuclease III [Opitutaceae bacterium]|jgi:exodeoxyribonuclease-3|nr:exodeoxyribonuclease III [Opitutaceae bacterium]